MFKSPSEVLRAELAEIRRDELKAKTRTGLFWRDETFLECNKVKKQFEAAIINADRIESDGN